MLKRMMFVLAAGCLLAADAHEWPGFACGMGIGGWLTNYKRFNVLPLEHRLPITLGDLEHFDTYITERDIANIRQMGFDHVRLGFDQIVLEESPGRYRERTFRKIDDFIGWCAKHNLNVVLNLHKAIGNYCDIPEKVSLLDDAALQERFIALWLEIERRYHDKSNLAFELLNEVRNVKPALWNDLADRTIRALRAQNPSRWIVIGSICWNSPDKLKDLKIWEDPRVVYTFHMYSPFEFTHQRGVLQASTLYYNRVMEYPSHDVERYRAYNRLHGVADGGYKGVASIDRAYLKRCLSGALAFAKAHPNKILWNGEFGTIRHAPPESRVAFMRDVVSICREAGIPWCVWNYLSTPNDGNRFSLVDDDTRKILSSALLKACRGELRPPEDDIVLSNAFGVARIECHGANLRCWRPAGEREVIGCHGVPIYWPWAIYEGAAGCRIHGLTPYFDWTVKARTPDRVVLQFSDDESTRALWPHRFQAEMEYRLGAQLHVAFRVTNTDVVPYDCTELLHPYVNVTHPTNCVIEGVSGAKYFWKAERDKGANRVWQGVFPVAQITGGKPGIVFDRGEGSFTLVDLDRRVTAAFSGGIKFVSYVAPEGCVSLETGTIYRDCAYTLVPGQTHCVGMCLSVASSSSAKKNQGD